MKPFKSWWVYRDGKPDCQCSTRTEAQNIREFMRRSTDDIKWTVVRVLVTPLPKRRTEPMKWNRNMSEAPRDGTRILIWDHEALCVEFRDGYWCDGVSLIFADTPTRWAPIEPPRED